MVGEFLGRTKKGLMVLVAAAAFCHFAVAQEAAFSWDFSDCEIKDILFAVSVDTGISIVPDDTVSGKGDLKFAGGNFELAFESFLKAQIGGTYYKEWQGLFGIPDYVCFEKQDNDISVVSFELKLTDWKTAIIQAFRYRSFSNKVYVVMPEDTVKRAVAHTDQFDRYGIGLASFTSGRLTVLVNAKTFEPYSQNLREKVDKRVKKSRRKPLGALSVLI